MTNKQIKLTKLTCSRCGKQWTPRVPDPRTCPKCNSPYWNVPRKNISK